MPAVSVRVIALLTITALSACSGSGESSTSPIPARVPIATSSAPASASSTTRATFVVHWTSAAQAASTARKRQTISASTQSISVTINGGAPTVVNKPTLTGSPSTTSIAIVAPPGNDSFTFTAWDKANAEGAILDQSTVSQNIVANANNTVAVSLDGVCAALVPTLYQTGLYVQSQNTTVPLVSGSRTILTSARIIGPFPKTFQFTRIDADGNTVLSSGDVTPILVTQSGAVPNVTITPVTSSPGNTMFNLTPTPTGVGLTTTITATTQDCGSGSALFPNSFQVSTSAAVLVADANVGILAYDQSGAQLGTAPISTIKNITGLAYSPNSGGYLVAIEPKSSGGGIAFQTLTPSGSAIGSSSFTPHNDSPGYDADAATETPANLAYDPTDGNFYFALQAANPGTSGGDGAVEEYSISGATATFVQANTFAIDPYSLAVVSNGNLVSNDLYNYGSGSNNYYYNVDEFADNLTPLASYQTSTTTTSLSYDSTRGTILGLNPAGTGTAYNPQSNVGLDLEFTFEVPDIAYNDYVSAYSSSNDELYLFAGASSAGISGATVAAGGSTTSNLLTGAFPGLSNPTQALALP